MFFRLCNSPATFQTMMNDILIYSSSLVDHQRITQEILQTLHSYKLFLQLEKCKFKHQEVDYLGLVISKDHVVMDPVVGGITVCYEACLQSLVSWVRVYC